MALKSRQNAHIQLYRRLREAATRREQQLYLIEGINGVDEALRHDVPLQSVLWSDRLGEQPRGQGLLQALLQRGVTMQAAEPELLEYVSSTETSQGVVAVAPLPTYPLASLVGPQRWTLLLDGVSDPGNLGTMVRTAAAAGADGVLVWGQGCDPWNPKSVRASAGVACWYPVVPIDTLESLSGTIVVATSSHQGVDYDADSERYANGTVLVVGSEAHGVSPAVAARVDHWIRIPLAAGVESLNAAVAGGVILFHARHMRTDCARGA